jgi:hypothetical protein
MQARWLGRSRSLWRHEIWFRLANQSHRSSSNCHGAPPARRFELRPRSPGLGGAASDVESLSPFLPLVAQWRNGTSSKTGRIALSSLCITGWIANHPTVENVSLVLSPTLGLVHPFSSDRNDVVASIPLCGCKQRRASESTRCPFYGKPYRASAAAARPLPAVRIACGHARLIGVVARAAPTFVLQQRADEARAARLKLPGGGARLRAAELPFVIRNQRLQIKNVEVEPGWTRHGSRIPRRGGAAGCQ